MGSKSFYLISELADTEQIHNCNIHNNHLPLALAPDDNFHTHKKIDMR